MSTHARLSPSSAPKWCACPGSILSEEGIPDIPSEIAEWGTCSHWVMEQAVKFDCPAQEFLGKQLFLADRIYLLPDSSIDYVFHAHVDAEMEISGHRWTISSEMCDVAQEALNYVVTISNGHPILSERKVYPGNFFNREDCWGTADLTIRNPHHPAIYDLKTGFKRVQVENNLQLLLYAIGDFALLAQEDRGQVKTYTIGIISPRAPIQGQIGNEIVIPVDHLYPWIEWFRQKAEATDDPKAALSLIPGEIQCRWCKAKPTCPALTDLMFGEILEVENPPEDRDSVIAESEPALLREPESLEFQQLSGILELVPLARDWLSAVESYATELALKGTEIPGHKLVRKNTKRRWTEPTEVIIKKLTSSYKIPKKEVIQPAKLISPAAAQKMISGMELSDRQRTNFNKLIEKPLGAPTLVTLSDPRSPITPDSKTMFGPPDS